MASSVASKPELGCLQTIVSLNANPVAPTNIVQTPNVLRALMSERNMQYWNEIERITVPGKAKPTVGAAKNAARFVYEYETPMCAGGTSAPSTNICAVDADTAETQKYLEVGVDKTAERHWSTPIDDFNNLCESPSQRRANFMRRKAFEILLEANTEAIQEMYANVNPYSSGTASVGADTETVKVITSTGNIVNAGFAKIKGTYRKAYYNGPLYIFGGDKIATYFDVKDFQGLSQDGNGMVDPFDAMPFIYDHSIDPELQTLEAATNPTASHGITIPVGGFGIAIYHQNEGAQALSLETRLSTTIDIEVLPGLEVTFDYDLKFDDCNKVYKEQLKLHYGFMSIPASEYCDSLGLNYHWLFDCGDITCTDVDPA